MSLMTEVGLRIDVDTLRGTRRGVPELLKLLTREKTRASFFFAVGPDNMGRHLWRLLKPAFLLKMLRTRAASLYGWDILFKGTFWPGPLIGKACADVINGAAAAGHEVGLHAWDHQRWQSRIEKFSADELKSEIERGYETLARITNNTPAAFAAPAWRITPTGLAILSSYPFRYVSNCRGHSIFRPRGREGDKPLHIEIPTTLPTYDEVVGQQCRPEHYNDFILDRIRPGKLNVLTIHAEVEGICGHEMFARFLARARDRDIVFKPLGELLPAAGSIATGRITRTCQPGREGWIAVQE